MPLSRLGRVATALLAVVFVAAGISPVSAAEPTFSISGQVFLAGGGTAPAGISVQATREGTSGVSAYESTQADGRYTISGLIAGRYRIAFVTDNESSYSTQYYPGFATPTEEGVQWITVGPNATGKNITLPLKAVVSGTIYLGTSATPATPGQAIVKWAQVSSAGGTIESGQVGVGAGGAYSLKLAPGRYVLRAESTTTGYQPFTLRYDTNPAISLVVASANRTGIDGVIPPLGSISGTVSLGATGTLAGAGAVEVKLSRPDVSGGEPVVLTDASGHYSFTGLYDIAYNLTFRHVDGMFETSKPPQITLGPSGRDVIRNVTLANGPTLSGTVRLDGVAAGSGVARVTAVGPVTRSALTDSTGGYSIPSLLSGSYDVQVEYLAGSDYPDAWFPLVSSKSDAESVQVYDSSARADFDLPRAVSFSGTVLRPSGTPAGSVEITANYVNYGQDTYGEVSTTTDSSGRYSFERVLPGDYRIEAYWQIRQFWGHTRWNPIGETLVLAPGDTRTGIDIQTFTPGGVTGTASCSYCTNPDIQFAQFAVGLQALNDDGEWVGVTNIIPGVFNGASYSLAGYAPGTYRLAGGFNNDHGVEWGIGISSTFTITAGNTATKNITLQAPPADRIAGADRFVVAASIAQRAFPSGADVVYIANGLNFPDALGAGPAAVALGGPLLLVTPTSVPDVVLDALEELDPDRIIIAGGTGAVSAGVEVILEEFAPVDRNLGANRFATSIATAREAFEDSGAETVFIATGLNFPDALSAGSAAASMDAPVVIVNGAAGGIEPQLADLLDDLQTERVFIVGSTGAVSAGIESAIRGLGITVDRFAGTDRYQTSAYVNRFAYGSPSTVYLAVGTTFPDALAGGVLAGVQEAPLLVTPPTCTPRSGVDYLLTVPSKIILLGGTGALAPPATLFKKC